MPIFRMPNIEDITTLDEVKEVLGKMLKEFSYLGYNLDSDNVTSLKTEYCDISSENGETTIDGPTIKMYDRQGCLEFNGSSTVVTIPDYDALHVGNVLTFMGWIKPDSAMTTRQGLFTTIGANISANCWEIEIGPGNGGTAGRIVVITPGVWNLETANNTLKQGEWQHIAFTHDGSSQKIYLNGNEVTLITNNLQTFADNTYAKMFGFLVYGYSFYFNGGMKKCSLWNKALTQAEIKQYMNSELSKENGLVGYWGFSEGKKTTAKNGYKSGNSGTITDPTWAAAQERMKLGYDPKSGDFVFDMYNAAAKQTINLDSTGDYVFCGGTIRTDIVGKSRIELSGNSLKTYYNNGTTDYLNGPVWGVGSSKAYGDLSFYDTGVETMRIYNKLTGTGWSIRPMNGASLDLGVLGSYVYPCGAWNFSSSSGSVSGLKVNVGGTVYSVYVG